MKALLPFLISMIAGANLTAQLYQTVQRPVPLLTEQTFYLNSQTRIGGKPRNAIKIELPENAVQWSYAFTTSKKEGGGDNIKLLKQVTDFVAKGLLGSNVIGITTNLAYQVIKPTGAGVVDVYLTDAEGQEQFFATSWNRYSYAKPERTFDGSRENIRDGLVLVNDVKQRVVYLCFNNPSSTEGLYVTIEAIAMVTAQEYVDEWTPDSKDRFFNECADALRFQPEAIREVCDCYKNRTIARYKPAAWLQMGAQEQKLLQQGFIEECLSLTGWQEAKAKVRIKALTEEIRGLELVADYPALTRRYRELLELGEDNAALYYSLSRSLLLTKQPEEAKIVLTKALGKYPKETGLWLNLAHHHLLSGNEAGAIAIYQQYRGERVAKKYHWEEAVNEDFREMEAQGISHPAFANIRQMLGE